MTGRIKSNLGALSVFFLSYFVYLWTLAPTITFGDSGELVTAAYSLGIAHPPGFPIWCFLVKIFTLLVPFKNIAWRANLASAFFSSMSAVFLYFLIRDVLFFLQEGKNEFSKRKIEIFSLVFALMLPFTRALWKTSVVAEVYTLNLLFGIVTTYLLFLWLREKGGKNLLLFIFAFLCGLSLTNHYLMLTRLPAYALIILIIDWKILLRPKVLLPAFLCFFLGLSFYLYLPIRARANPALNWGNPRDWQGFLSHVTRQQYAAATATNVGGVSLPIVSGWTPSLIFQKLYLTPYYSARILVNELWFLPVFSLLGLYFLYKQKKELFWFFSLVFLFSELLFNFLRVTEHFSPVVIAHLYPTAISIALAAVGVFEIIKRSKVSFAVVVTASLFVPIAFFILNFRACSMRGNRIAEDFAKDVFAQIEPDSTLVGIGDLPFAIFYYQQVEGWRPDVAFYDRNGSLLPHAYPLPERDSYKQQRAFSEVGPILEAFDQKLISETKGGVYYLTPDNCKEAQRKSYLQVWKKPESSTAEDLTYFNKILSYKKNDLLPDSEGRFAAFNYHSAKAWRLYKEGKKVKAITEFRKGEEIAYDYHLAFNNLASCYAQMGYPEDTIRVLKKSTEISWRDPVAHYNLGRVYLNLGKNNEAEGELKIAMRLGPKYGIAAAKNLGFLYLNQKKPQEAKATFDYIFGIEDFEISKDVFLGQAMANLNLGNFDEAVKLANEALKKDKNYPEAYKILSLAYVKLGENDKAAKMLKKYVKLKPEDEEARKVLENLAPSN